MTEVEALKKAVAKAEEKAAAEQAQREKYEARVIKAGQELQEAVKKCKTLEQSLTEKESEITRAHQVACDARRQTQGALQEIQEAREITAGKVFFHVKKVFQENIMLYNFKFRFLHGYLRNFLAAYRMPPNSTEPKKGTPRISSSGPSIWHRIIRCPLSIN